MTARFAIGNVCALCWTWTRRRVIISIPPPSSSLPPTMHASLSQGSTEADHDQRFLVKVEHDEDSRPELKLYSPDSQFWYPDGTIVIVAQNVGFRIYKGLLAEESDVFDNMFNNATPTPQPSQTEGSVPPADGCPVVCVLDTAAEMRSIRYLASLHPSRTKPLAKSNSTPCST